LKTPQSGASSTTTRNSSLVSLSGSSSGLLVAIVEGRGSARGEIGLASISLSCPTLILCQFSDTRTYTRTLAKLALFNPTDILVKLRLRLNVKD
jgi:DNA mismatch repair ATPase MutS